MSKESFSFIDYEGLRNPEIKGNTEPTPEIPVCIRDTVKIQEAASRLQGTPIACNYVELCTLIVDSNRMIGDCWLTKNQK